MTINQWTNNYWSINCCLVPWGLAACCRCRGRGQCSQWQIINQWTNKPLSINQLLLPVTLRAGSSLPVLKERTAWPTTFNQWTNNYRSINCCRIPVPWRLAACCRYIERGRRSQWQSINEPTTIGQSTAAWYFEGWRLVAGVEGEDSVANHNPFHVVQVHFVLLLPKRQRSWNRVTIYSG